MDIAAKDVKRSSLISCMLSHANEVQPLHLTSLGTATYVKLCQDYEEREKETVIKHSTLTSITKITVPKLAVAHEKFVLCFEKPTHKKLPLAVH